MTFKYNAFSIPVITTDFSSDNENLEYNKAFEKLFLTNREVFSKSKKTFSESINKMINSSLFHWNGILYQVNKIEEDEKTNSYIITPSENSVALSFLWLKHDLINILNPIIGFSDILTESEEIPEDDAQLIEKIRSNSQKFYEQVQKIAALQALTLNDSESSSGKYLMSDFLLELNNKLRVEKSIEEDIQLNVVDNGHVSDRISNPDFRFAFEEHFAFLNNHQTKPSIKMKMHAKDDCLIVESIFEDCLLSSRQVEDLKNVELYISENKAIQRLQSDPLNYLLLGELLAQINGYCELSEDKETVSFKMCFPLLETLKHEAEMIEIIESTNNKSVNPFDFPPQILEELQKLCSGFHGFMILDDWEDLTSKMASLNKKHNDTNLEQLIKDINMAILAFDVEKLKSIFKNCQLIFNTKNDKNVTV